MKQEDTKQRILEKALELFSAQGYDSVSVGEIAAAVGIKAPSLYNHFSGKQAIFDAIVEATAAKGSPSMWRTQRRTRRPFCTFPRRPCSKRYGRFLSIPFMSRRSAAFAE